MQVVHPRMFLSKTPSKSSFGLLVIANLVAGICSAADNPLWEPAKVVAVEQVSTPAKEPDVSCRAVPKGATPPARCRPSALRAEQFWRVTVEVGNKRFVVRPYRPAKLLDAFNQDATDYVDPHLTAGSSIEAAVVSSKAIRIRTDQGQGIAALVDSQELLSTPVTAPRPQAVVSRAASGLKVVLLENGDFLELETQEIKSQDIGDGVALYSFPGDSSQIRAASNNPVFLVMAESDTATAGNVELSRLQVSKGIRQMPYSAAKNRSASSIPITVTAVSATLRKFTVKEPLPPGEYVILLENSNRGFLFAVR
jgi:hypothetical protein